VFVPKTYEALTTRRVLTSEWVEGEKLSQSTADDVGTLVNVGVICYLKQLLDTGFFHVRDLSGFFYVCVIHPASSMCA
jgi:aarF domain-containing kinase